MEKHNRRNVLNIRGNIIKEKHLVDDEIDGRCLLLYLVIDLINDDSDKCDLRHQLLIDATIEQMYLQAVVLSNAGQSLHVFG